MRLLPLSTLRHPVQYRGIEVMTALGVHDQVAAIAGELFLEERRPALRVLDAGAGQGALSQRLYDAGFTNIEAWELEPAKFRATATVRPVDLNQAFPTGSEFDLIVSCEVIEHLENPFQFMREIARCLDPNGFAIITTPNIESVASRIKFLLLGRHRWFSDFDYDAWGHISPISSWQFDKVLRRSSLKLVRRTSNLPGAYAFRDPGLRGWALGVASLLLTPVVRGSKQGDDNIWVVAHA